jgi:hypothetical protein
MDLAEVRQFLLVGSLNLPSPLQPGFPRDALLSSTIS